MTLCDTYSKKIDYLNSLKIHVDLHNVSSMFSEDEVTKLLEEVTKLLETQRMNCWVAATKCTTDKRETKQWTLYGVVKRLFRKKLTYKERIDWFVANFYETGMEYQIIYDSFKNEDLDRIKWYDDFIKIPEYKDEL